MAQPKISVIVPVYNVEQYLCRCIDSILSQSYKDFELLLINDGSKDSSGKICNEYAKLDERIHVFHEENGGVSKARNLGLEQAKGEWVCFVDSDDWIENDYLNNFGILESLSKNSLVIQGIEHVSNQTDTVLWKVVYKNIEFKEHDLGQGIAEYCLLHSGFPYAKLFNRALIKENQIKFDTKISYHEDHLFVFEYFYYVHMVRLSASTAYKYVYYGRNTSLSSKVHFYLESECAYQMLSKKLSELITLFKVKDDLYINKIAHFVYQIRMEGLFFCYSLEKKNVRLAYLKKFKNDIVIMKRQYNPQSLEGRLFKFSFFLFPSYLLDKIILLHIRKTR